MMVILYAIIGILLFCYSYTQVDLGLTLSQVNIWLHIQQWFQHIGYFERPLSTWIFLGIVLVLFLLYILVLRLAYQKKLSIKKLWMIIGVITITTVFSYPAFSYDLFNHMFTAKTVLVYHKNPYMVTPLQFAGVDPWLSFMHWTHVTSIYSPLWILMTLFPYILGFGYFLLILWNFKIFIVVFYLLAIWSIGKILESDGKVAQATGMALFALNPLVIIESTVSAHNDIVMMGLTLFAMAVYGKRNKVTSFFLLSSSIAIKIMTLFLIPAFFIRWNRAVALLTMIVGLALFLTQREIMAWYLLWIFPFIALFPTKWNLILLSGGISLGVLLRYAPFLYYGNWDPPVGEMKMWVTVIPITLAILIASGRFLFSNRNIRYFFD